ncbi:MAG: hypothetical protein CVV64_07435 [Candidatus Wallbacteria bacterium HGW-Wallbacteria-1]|jgi:MFS family permease|uniref:Major facilitator superfamily (MFS) profile domain-containing protein n=1 Tax=Candidatus Wallbacteria bacterium HGW-Wallbacteria-1 TaxID=2013854 RepID=A0A2N1PQS8_9BACT|nr:MAG: hypothetical protein CVV64_07435 [Candidatus Wallbacteria bacterium HGW-Wallbacteria-1]
MISPLQKIRTLLNTQNPVALKYLIITAIFEGIVFGVLLMQESVARIHFKAQDTHITIICILMHATFLFAMLIAAKIRGNYTRFLLLGAILGRGALLTVFLVKSVWGFLAALLVYYSFSSFQSPTLTEITRRSFAPHNRGRLYSIYRVFFLGTTVLASTTAGYLFDTARNNAADFNWIPWVFGFAGVCGIISFRYMLILCRMAGMDGESQEEGGNSIKWAAIMHNKPFLKFEAVFMIYGMAFISLTPVIPLFLIDVMKFSYTDYAWARGFMVQSIVMLLTPLAGILFDKIEFHRMAAIACALLAVFPVVMIASETICISQGPMLFLAKPAVYGGFAIFGVAMAMIGVIWSLAGLRFSGDGDSSSYQAFHVAMVGIRGILGPLCGLFMLKYFSFRGAFTFATSLWVIAALLMMNLSRKSLSGQCIDGIQSSGPACGIPAEKDTNAS